MDFKELYEAVRARIATKPTIVIGIVGLPGSGKSIISTNLGSYLTSNQHIAAIPWEGDMYSTSSRENRTTMIKQHFKDKLAKGEAVDPDWPRLVYCYNFPLMVEHFDNFRRREGFSAKSLCHPKKKSLDLRVQVSFEDEKDTEVIMDEERKVYSGYSTWVLADFALLTKGGIREKLDVLVYIDAPYDVRAGRIRTRLQNLPQPLVLDEDLFKSIESSQARDFEVNPEFAQIVVDNTDYHKPRIIRA